MTRFLVLSVFFLGWAFYEASGGSEFEPPAENALSLTEEPVQEATETAEDEADVAAAVPEVAPVVPVAPVVRRPLVSAARAIPEEDLPPRYQGAVSSAGNAVGTVSIGAAVGVIEHVEAPAAEIRLVRGNRVNMRAGPGKRNAVVARLSQGDPVEILEQPGNGWVKGRVVDTGVTGWMAEFLLVAAN